MKCLREASEKLGRNVVYEEGRFRVALRVFASSHQTSLQALSPNNEFDNFKQRLLDGKNSRIEWLSKDDLSAAERFDPKKITFPRASELQMGQIQTSLRQYYRNALLDVEKSIEDMSDAELFLRENKKSGKITRLPYVLLVTQGLDTGPLLRHWRKPLVSRIPDKAPLESKDKDVTRFKLKGTISTNGLILLAYGTAQTKRQP
ncbi:hypothetical protein BX616_008292 [Lobosporangium transversale]|uniref:Uncharacterized protein n=1 Tax=Lobosporangium transversale TaxID=64571 RepID=A0A1Y2GBH3_9FUNG|nr:hypothetical protein BCR41DRAFT_400266 [Lobosporangium transversale]KAF9914440.1 hypothetical protein BX616_008292 [Lobosporangium transversale]ORZ06126.1 hypothetical protein BCR41DRAFT_400266 [Lobosporangium transversale]|eukprot:XP_021877395.1 hypothetical protein BCR41DRAFT_400266 [Lobosporangium transversale]